MNCLIRLIVLVALGFGVPAVADEEGSSPIAPQSRDGFGGDPQLAFAPAPGESRPVLVAAGPKASKTKGKWVSAKVLKAKKDKTAAAKASGKKKSKIAKVSAKSKKKIAIAAAKSKKDRKVASVKKKRKKAK